MQVSELFTRLSYGVFSNLSIGMEGNGTIQTDKKPKIVGYLNEALLKLYSRFVLKQSELILMQDVSLRLYRLTAENALSNTSPAPGQVLFIQDTTLQPFPGDLIKILEVYDDCGCIQPLNDAEHPSSLFTPQTDVLQIPKPLPGKPLSVIYQARHSVIGSNDYTAVIDIPATLEVALASYIAYLTYSHMNGQEHAVKAAEHLGLYEATCAEVTGRDLVNGSSSQTNTRFENRGWV